MDTTEPTRSTTWDLLMRSRMRARAEGREWDVADAEAAITEQTGDPARIAVAGSLVEARQVIALTVRDLEDILAIIPRCSLRRRLLLMKLRLTELAPSGDRMPEGCRTGNKGQRGTCG